MIHEDAGLAQLNACLVTLLTEVREMRREADPTAPMTAEDLCRRWQIPGETPKHQLFNLARRCGMYGLEAAKGTRGWEALFSRSDVLAAEAFMFGKSKRRRTA